jgi:hypothetical protein
VTETNEDRLLRMMADQQEEFAQFKKNVSERLERLERRPRRSNLFPGEFEGVAEFFSIGLFIAGAFILVRVIIAALAKTKNEGGSRGNPSLSKA